MSRPRNQAMQGTISKFFRRKPKLPAATHNSVSEQDDKVSGKKRAATSSEEVAGSSKRQRSDASCPASVDTSAPKPQNLKIEAAKQKLDTYSHNDSSPRPSGSQITIDDLKRLDAQHIEVNSKFFDKNDGLNNSTDDHDECNDAPEENKTEVEASKRAKGKLSKYAKKKPSVVKVKQKYTPLEQQFMEIKEQHSDAILFVECGYKYRFFGDDAEIAAKELSIFAHLDHNFMTASIPTHRLYVHVRRLVAKGYKVGVVKQTETAALKAAGDNRSAPFSRRLSALYTKATLIGEDVDPVIGGNDTQAQNANCHLTCIYEPDLTSRNRTHQIAILSVQPSTGEIIYDMFNDVPTRSELETRLTHLQPAELLLPLSLTTPTEKVIKQLVAFSCRSDDRVRLERLEDDIFETRKAFDGINEFYGDSPSLIQILQLPQGVLSCLNALLTYLKDFNLHNVLKITSNIQKFSVQNKYMNLPASTLRNLEIFKNLTDGREHGSLIWVMDQTLSRFGSRLLRHWLTKPLLDASALKTRQDAVTCLLKQELIVINKLKERLSTLPDLEKGLCTIFHKKCSTQEFLMVCKALSDILDICSVKMLNAPQSELISEIVKDMPDLLDGVKDWVNALDAEAAKTGNKTKLFLDESAFPDLLKCKADISRVEGELEAHRKEVAKVLGLISFSYKTVMGTEFLIDVKNSDVKRVPKEWIKINGTKATSRFHTPFIISAGKRLSQARERLTIVCQEAWNDFLSSFEDVYPRYRKAVHHLATLDALLSLASLAQQDGFCKPGILSQASNEIHIEGGRHPVVSVLLGGTGQYVPNDTNLAVEGERCMIITGPNMGGKSSYIKQVALLTLMAQMGSYVPADSASFSIVDAIYTRMGASDELFAGRSTFMVELQEASEIMASATQRSLVILDELGRGTSTHDGVAIAYAALKYFVEYVKSLTLFVTHYPPLAEIERIYPGSVSNYHMSFLIHDEEEESKKGGDAGEPEVITFLYQLVAGVADRSYGLNVARLANIPELIIRSATHKSHTLEDAAMKARLQRTTFVRLFTAPEGDVQELIGSLFLDDS